MGCRLAGLSQFHSRVLALAVASSRPSGLNATPQTVPGRGRSGCAGTRRWPGPTAAPCWSPLPVASSRPSGLNATPVTTAVVAGQGAQALAGGRVPQPRRLVAAGGGEQPPVRAERHAPDRGRSWPVRVRRHSPVAGSHSRAVLSSLAVASSRPSGLNATPRPAVVAGQGAQALAGGRVPQPRRLVVAGGGEQPPVRAERHAADPAVVAGQGAQALAGGRVPQPRRLVVAGGGEQPPVRAERHVPTDRRHAVVAGQGAQALAGGRVPQPRRPCRSLAVASSRPSGLNATPTDRAVVAGQGAGQV